MRRNPITLAVLFLFALAPVSLVAAQTPEIEEDADRSSSAARQSDRSGAAPEAREEVHLNLVDHKLALSLAVDTQMQIELGRSALESIHNEALRRLVDERLESQQAFVAQLESITAGRTSEALDQARREINDDQGSDKARRFRLADLRRNATAMIVRIRMEVLQKYCHMVCGDLKRESGADFDRDYLQCELLGEMQMLATLEVFADEASADFAAVIDRQAVAVKERLERTRQFSLQLDALPLVGAGTADAPVVETAVKP